MLKMFHAFSGIDSQRMAEKIVFNGGGYSCNTIGTMEIDCDAVISSALIHENNKFFKYYNQEWNNEQYESAKEWLKKRNIGFDFEKGKSKLDRMKKDKLKQLYIASVCTKNYGDISLANKVKIKDEIDLFTYSSPCQSFSIAGKQAGLNGTSGLLLECEKFIEINKPKFLLLENVKNLVGKKFINDFKNWLKILDTLGYNSYYEILNAKDFNVPQNRERVFCLSIRKDIDKGFKFPKGFVTKKCINDILEDNVEEKYYLNKDIVNRFIFRPVGNNIIGTTAPETRSVGQRDIVYNSKGIMGTLLYTDYKQPKQILVLGDIDKKGWFDLEKRVYDKNGLSPTLTTNLSPKIVSCKENLKIRKLTPRECWRLMGFEDNDYNRVDKYMSDTQKYKQAGNSIVVNCLVAIFQELKIQYNL